MKNNIQGKKSCKLREEEIRFTSADTKTQQSKTNLEILAQGTQAMCSKLVSGHIGYFLPILKMFVFLYPVVKGEYESFP